MEKAEVFSKLTIEASLIIWKTFHKTDKEPDYLGRLDYNSLLNLANQNLEKINEIKKTGCNKELS